MRLKTNLMIFKVIFFLLTAAETLQEIKVIFAQQYSLS